MFAVMTRLLFIHTCTCCLCGHVTQDLFTYNYITEHHKAS